MIRVIVCGGRDYLDREAVDAALDAVHRKHGAFTLVHGGANGADLLAGLWAASRGVEFEVHPAAWTQHGKRAGPMRNQHMLELGTDAVVAFPGGRGTADMVSRAEKAGVPVWRVGWSA
ncbi:MAG: DUF2493 domain-containing protein [Miltoncostaeaceae bacterium]